ncbi:hypothetical protein METBIDRAFT_39535, partial [Metschnikowia bicuspidata var. bicuspidata NRRL YB-4993]
FMFFRILVLFFTTATIVLLAWSLVGCYKNESYLTNNYLISLQVSNLNLSTLFEDTSFFSKRDSLISEAQAVAATASIPDSIATLVSEISGDFSSALNDIIASASPSDLGLSDMYSVGFYGYCKGELTGNVTDYSSELGELGKQFRNDNVNYTYCSAPEFGYKLDPLALIKHEMMEQIQNYGDGLATLSPGLSDLFISELLTVASSLTYENLGLPGNLKQDLGMLNSVTIAGFSLIFAGACLSFVSFAFQMVGLCCSPGNMCLSLCNFLLMFLVALIVIIGSGLTTGVFLYVRNTVNQDLDDFGVKTYLSQQFYAFAWSAAVSALMFVVLSIIGYCCGCFHPRHRKPNRSEPEVWYDHKM